MTVSICKALLEARLKALGTFPTALENVTFQPATGTPYQKAEHLIANPDGEAFGSASTYFQPGVFQVSLFYPLNTGDGAALARAEAIATHFKKGTTLTQGAVRVLINAVPKIASGRPDGDRWMIPVSIPWQSQLTS
jgi:hypothetical protein